MDCIDGWQLKDVPLAIYRGFDYKSIGYVYLKMIAQLAYADFPESWDFKDDNEHTKILKRLANWLEMDISTDMKDSKMTIEMLLEQKFFFIHQQNKKEKFGHSLVNSRPLEDQITVNRYITFAVQTS